MLGRDVEQELRAQDLDIAVTDREIDITRYSELEAFSLGKQIDWIVNCSAYTAVDKAEDEPDAAFAVNSGGVSNIARIAVLKNARLIHFSTDYVFF